MFCKIIINQICSLQLILQNFLKAQFKWQFTQLLTQHQFHHIYAASDKTNPLIYIRTSPRTQSFVAPIMCLLVGNEKFILLA